MYGGIKLHHQLRNSTFLDTHIYPKALWACSRITNPTFEWELMSAGICSAAGTLSAAALTCTGCSFSWQREAQVRKVLKDRLVSFTSSEWLRAPLCLAGMEQKGIICKVTLSSQNLAARFLLCWQSMGAADLGLSTQHSWRIHLKQEERYYSKSEIDCFVYF